MCRIQLLFAARHSAVSKSNLCCRAISSSDEGCSRKVCGGMDSKSRRRTCSDSIFSMSKFKFQTVLLCSLESTLFNFVRDWQFNFGRSRYIWQPVECSNNYLQSLTTVKQLPGTIDFALQGSAGCPCHAR